MRFLVSARMSRSVEAVQCFGKKVMARASCCLCEEKCHNMQVIVSKTRRKSPHLQPEEPRQAYSTSVDAVGGRASSAGLEEGNVGKMCGRQLQIPDWQIAPPSLLAGLIDWFLNLPLILHISLPTSHVLHRSIGPGTRHVFFCSRPSVHLKCVLCQRQGCSPQFLDERLLLVRQHLVHTSMPGARSR